MVEKYQALTAGLTLEELLEFSRSFRAELLAEGLVQGNFSSGVSASRRRSARLSPSGCLFLLFVCLDLFIYASLCSLRRSQNSSCST